MGNRLRSSVATHIAISVLLCWFIASPSFAFDAEIDIGSVSLVKTLFSYPNSGHEDQTIEETVQHYLNDAIRRENLGPYAAAFAVKNGRGKITFSGPDNEAVSLIARRYKAYFEIGEVGSLEYLELRRATRDWDAQWQFLLPQGIAIENARVIEVMDFPPISLIAKQDYLDSRTTNQWWYLLGENGVTESEKPLYSSILDIVLVAAPASHGKKLRDAGIYDGHFPKYTDAMVQLLSRNSKSTANRPILALGYPIREWIKQRWNVDIGVNEVALVEIEPGRSSPVIGGNHPAYYLRSKGSKGADDPSVRAILRQDLITAAWAAEIGRTPDADPFAVLSNAKSRWDKDDDSAYFRILNQLGLAPPIDDSKIAEMRESEPSAQDLLIMEKHFYETDYSYE